MVQLAMMGEPELNDAVLDFLKLLPSLYVAPGLMPALSTIAPAGREKFFERLLDIGRDIYRGRFQLQFSLHTTDAERRDWLLPPKKWDFAKIARYGERFYVEGGRKITLNFALAEGMPLDAEVLSRYFDPEKFLVKITPVNPTFLSVENGIHSHIRPREERYEIIDSLRDSGYEVVLSIGELEENHIGSNCGQHVTCYLRTKGRIEGGYTYEIVGSEGAELPVGG